MSILNPCASAGALEWVKEVHRHALRAGLESDARVGNALVHMYAKSGSIDDARQVFDRIVERHVITWNVMIGGLAQHGLGHEAFSLLLQMESGGFVGRPSHFSEHPQCMSKRRGFGMGEGGSQPCAESWT